MNASSVAPARLALLQIHLAAVLAGGTGLFGKFLHLPPATITCGRSLVGALVLLVAAGWGGASLRPGRGRDLFTLALSGVVLAVHWLAFFQAVQVSTVAIALLAFATFPLFLTFLEPLFCGERLRARDLVIAAVVVAGLALVTPSFDPRDRLTQGMLWGVASALAYALLSLLSRANVSRCPPITVAFYQQAIAAAVVAPALWWAPAPLAGRDLLLLALLGSVFTALAQTLLVAGLRHVRAQVAGVIIALEPVYGILFAWLMLREVPTLRTLAGGGLICGAVLAASLLHAERPKLA